MNLKNLLVETKKIALSGLNNYSVDKSNDIKKIDYVTAGDLLIEKFLINEISKAYPHHNIISEESSEETNYTLKDHSWIIDPIDGTLNYMHSDKNYGISIAYYFNQEPISVAVEFPSLNETFAYNTDKLFKGTFLFLNQDWNKGTKIICPENDNKCNFISGNLLRTDIQKLYDEYKVVPRISGCAVLDLCNLACGKTNIVYYKHLKIWDYAAALPIATEAGAEVIIKTDDTLLVVQPKTDKKILDFFLK